MKLPNPLSLPIKGQCQCGQVRFSISSMPLTFYACHCTECQSQSASAFGLSLWAEKSALHVTGKTDVWSRKTDSGGEMDCFFCHQCGTRLWHESGRSGGVAGSIVSIKGGTIAALRHIEPIGHIWTRSKHAATVIPEGKLDFPDGNIDEKALINAWQDFLNLAKI